MKNEEIMKREIQTGGRGKDLLESNNNNNPNPNCKPEPESELAPPFPSLHRTNLFGIYFSAS